MSEWRVDGTPSMASAVWARELERVYALLGEVPETEAGVHRRVMLAFDGRRFTTWARVSVNGRSPDVEVRTYTTHPYELVRDLRTGKEAMMNDWVEVMLCEN